MWAYDFCFGDFVNDFGLVVLRIDGTVIGNCIHFLAFGTDFGDCILGCLLKLVDDAVHNVDKDHLGQGQRWLFACST